MAKKSTALSRKKAAKTKKVVRRRKRTKASS